MCLILLSIGNIFKLYPQQVPATQWQQRWETILNPISQRRQEYGVGEDLSPVWVHLYL